MEQKNKLQFSTPSVLVSTIGNDSMTGSEDWGFGGADLFDFRNWSSGIADLNEDP